MLHPDLFFSPDSAQRGMARQLFTTTADLPLFCPYGHVEARIFADLESLFAFLKISGADVENEPKTGKK
jgi:glucuronate isomerase